MTRKILGLVTGLLILTSAKSQEKIDLSKTLEARTFKKGEASLNYRLLRPASLAEGKTYPLVIFLHGAGERGDDNKAQLRHGVRNFASKDFQAKHPCFLIAPQCPRNQFWGFRKGGDPSELVLSLIEELCRELPIDRSRIYLTGLSMGGFGTWDLLTRKPELFAAGLPICGGGDPKKADRLANVPIWAFHGADDKVVPPARSREMIEAIKKAGGKPRYEEYKGVGHDSWTQTYANPAVLDWLFAQKRPPREGS